MTLKLTDGRGLPARQRRKASDDSPYSIYSEISILRDKHNGAIFLASLGRPRKMSCACRGKISIKVILGRFF